MDEQGSLNHTKWECKYHVVFIPKCRRKTLYQELRQYLGEVFRRLAAQKESQIEEGQLRPDHVHLMIAIPPPVRSMARDWIYQRQARDPFGAGVRREEAELCGSTVLGTRVLGVHRGPRRGRDLRVHPEAGARRQAIGPDEPRAMSRHRQVAQTLWGRVSDPA